MMRGLLRGSAAVFVAMVGLHDPAGAVTTVRILLDFPGGAGGAQPEGGVTIDAAGNLLVTADIGGTSDDGLIYRLVAPSAGKTAWTPQVAHRFTGGAGGAYPLYLVPQDAGDYLGVALDGGTSGFGTIFQLGEPSTGNPWSLHTLHTLQGTPDGAEPSGAPVGFNGSFYGTTSQGGGGGCTDPFGDVVDCGVIYRLSPPAAGFDWQYGVVHRFAGDANGHLPLGQLTATASGQLFGATSKGGSGCDGDGCGVIYALTPPAGGSGVTLRTIYRFPGGADGQSPVGSLVEDQAGDLYGVTSGGGVSGNDGYGLGTIFELIPPASGGTAWTHVTLYRFTSEADGFEPQAGLTVLSDGTLVGTTYLGGPHHLGTIYTLALGSSGFWVHKILHGFGASAGDGDYPTGQLAADCCHIYGVTLDGGKFGDGTVYQVTAD